MKGTKSIFIKIVALFLAFIVPIYILGFCIFFWGKTTITRYINDAEVTQVQTIMEGFQKDIEQIQSLQYNIFQDNDLSALDNAYSILDNFSRDQKIVNIEKRLLSIKNCSRYIKNVTLYLPKNRKKITYRTINPIASDELAEIHSGRNPKGGLIVKNEKVLLLACSISTVSEGDTWYPRFICEIELSKPEISKLLSQSIHGAYGGFILVDNNTPASVICSDGYLSNQDVLEQIPDFLTQSSKQFKLDHSTYRTFLSSSSLNITLIMYRSETEMLYSFNLYLLLFMLFTITTLVITVFFALSIRKMIYRPLRILLNGFKEIESGNMEVHIYHPGADEFNIIFHGFNQMVSSLNHMIDKVYKQEMLVQKSELRQLQSQINPHFLFNCFFILSRRIKYGDPDTASMMAEQLGEYFRFITRSASDIVPLADEVSHARIYADIQAMRFANRIQIDFQQLPTEHESLQVPRLILQPVIENSFEYGLEGKVSGGKLVVSFRHEWGKLIISIEDNGECITDDQIEALQNKIIDSCGQQTEITAFLNIHRRVNLMFGADSGVYLSRSEIGGLKTEILLSIDEKQICDADRVKDPDRQEGVS